MVMQWGLDLVEVVDNQYWETSFSTHFLSDSLAPMRSANVSRVSRIAALGCFGNLLPFLASLFVLIR